MNVPFTGTHTSRFWQCDPVLGDQMKVVERACSEVSVMADGVNTGIMARCFSSPLQKGKEETQRFGCSYIESYIHLCTCVERKPLRFYVFYGKKILEKVKILQCELSFKLVFLIL